MNKDTPMSILNNLMLRNQDAAQKYREAAALVDDDSLKVWMESLAAYREDLAGELREQIEDMPPSPMAMNTRSRSFLSEHWDEVRDTILLNNRKKIATLCHQSEQALSDYYRQSLDKEALALPMKVLLEEQHKKVLKVMRKTERMATVPMEKNTSFSEL